MFGIDYRGGEREVAGVQAAGTEFHVPSRASQEVGYDGYVCLCAASELYDECYRCCGERVSV